MLSTDNNKNEAGIPVFMIGRSAENGREILPALAPDFDSTPALTKPSSSTLTTLQHAIQHILVPIQTNTICPPIVVVHFCTSTAAARLELPLVLSGHQVSNPQTTLGSNTKRGASPRKPAALFVGAGFEREDYEAFRGDVGDGHGLAWVREESSDVDGLDDPDNWMVREGIGRVPRPEVLVRSVSKVLGRELLGAR